MRKYLVSVMLISVMILGAIIVLLPAQQQAESGNFSVFGASAEIEQFSNTPK